MEINKIKLNAKIISFDFISINDFIYINEENQIYRNDHYLDIDFEVLIDDPIIKILSDSEFLLINRSNFKSEENCWIITNKGILKESFFIDNVYEVLVTKNYIIASYGDSMLDIGSEYGDAQIIVLNLKGELIFKYNNENNKTRIPFLEIKSILQKNEEVIFFLSLNLNGNFSVIEFCLKDFSSKRLFDLTLSAYFISFIIKNDKWYFIDFNFSNFEEALNNSSYSIYEVDNKGNLYKKYKMSGLMIKPIKPIIEYGFAFIHYSTLINTENKDLNYLII